MSYDLRIVPSRRIDLAAIRGLLLGSDGVEAFGDELVWSGEAVSATFVLDPAEIDVGVTSGDAPASILRREFLAVLDLASRIAQLAGAEVEDVQLGRALRPGDDEAVEGFGGS